MDGEIAFVLVSEELSKAEINFPPLGTYHEGYAVILEELDELWDEIKTKAAYRSENDVTKEATQVAAMALRFLIDLC